MGTARHSHGGARFHVEVENTGKDRAGSEVVQAYFEPVRLTFEYPAPLPKRQLFDFQKIHLAPGARKTLSFDLADDDLALADANGDLIAAAGEYTIIFTNGVDQTVRMPYSIKTSKIVER